MKKGLSRLVCLLVGHRWKIIRRTPTWKTEYSFMAGVDADCRRCGKQWRDASPVSVGRCRFPED